MPDDLRVTGTIAIPDAELSESFILSSGAGGQNVNKVASAVQLRFDVLHSPSLPDAVRVRLLKLAGNRLTKEGVLVLNGREIARTRRTERVRRATLVPKPRKPTRPTRASKERRIESKKRDGRTKQQR